MTTYPNVPLSPGVPPVVRSPSAPPTPDPPRATGDATSTTVAGQSSTAPQWGIFDTGNNPIIAPDTILAVDFKRDYSTPDYPIEDGGFETYNKVARPFEAKFTMAKGGSIAARQNFIAILELITADLRLYNVVTPEHTWLNANVTHWDYDRKADRGATLITVNVWLREIRVAPAPAFKATKTAAAQAPVAGGTVQAATPTFAQSVAGRNAVSASIMAFP